MNPQSDFFTDPMSPCVFFLCALKDKFCILHYNTELKYQTCPLRQTMGKFISEHHCWAFKWTFKNRFWCHKLLCNQSCQYVGGLSLTIPQSRGVSRKAKLFWYIDVKSLVHLAI